MTNSALIGYVSNIPALSSARLVEGMAMEYLKSFQAHPVLLNCDSELMFLLKPGRRKPEDAVARYGSWLLRSWIPYLNLDETITLFEDGAKSKHDLLMDNRDFLVTFTKLPSAKILSNLDSLVLVVTAESSSISFVYAACKLLISARKKIPLKVVVFGEPLLEKAVEFYVTLEKEVRVHINHAFEFSFGGSVFFEKEETQIADQFGVLLNSVYPEGTTQGQIKYTVKKVFAKDLSELSVNWTDRLKVLAETLDLEKSYH